MNKENYISLKAEEVHKQLITDIALNLDEAPKLLDELAATDRYREDHIFRTSIETAKAYLLYYQGKASEVIKEGGNLIEVAIAFQEWELLSLDYNVMANAYFILGLYEKALEYYYNAINNEKEHGFKNALPVAYANVGLIFLNMDLHEKAVEYLRLALGYIEYADKNYFRFREKKTYILADIMTSTTKIANPDPEEIQKVYEQLIALDVKGLDSDIVYSYYLGLMYYCFWKKDYVRAKREYHNAMEAVKDNHGSRLVVLYAFIEECNRHKLELDFFSKELLEAERAATDEDPIDEPVVYTNLRDYYIMQGNLKKAEEIHTAYRVFLENNLELAKKKQVDSIQILEGIFKGSREVATYEYKNKELKLVAEEAIHNKNELQKTYNRIKMINEIGLNLTSSTDLKEVVNLIYKNIRNNIHVDTFILLEAEPEKNQMRSLINYALDVANPEVTLSLDREDSSFVKCYKTNSIVSSEDKDFQSVLITVEYDEEEMQMDNMRSALFIPLSIGDKVIGAYSIQSRYPNAYKQEALNFLKELRPYLEIALNNAVHSRKLQNEVARNIEIQEKLKEANSILSKMAGLDALTKISNRREFTEKFHALRKEADKADKSVSVFMFDIDDFKKYNDTYGHFEGDEALKKVAKVINKNISKNNGIAARFGGEEFISACIGLTPEENYMLGEKIRNEILKLGIENIQTDLGILSISIGVAISAPGKIIVKSELMSLADEMLYEAKKTGKNKVVIHSIS